MDYRIAYTGGGSGGHITPLLAVADEVARLVSKNNIPNVSYFYFGNPEMYSQEFYKRNIQAVSIIPVKLRRYLSVDNLIDLIKFPFALLQALWKMFWVMPDVLFSKGGTGALPVVLAAWFYRVPVFIHDSDSVPGLTNSISYHFARRVGVSFSKALEYFSSDKVGLVGNPVRSFLIDESERLTSEQAKKVFGFDPEVPLIVVLGGSQGSQRINAFILDSLERFVAEYQVLHQTGPANFDEFKREIAIAAKDLIPELQKRYKAVPFLNAELKDALCAADLVIARAGSATLFEIALFNKPAILIPLKESARNHQYFNAYEYQRKGGCVVVEEDNLKPTILFAQIEKILSDTELYSSMSRQARDFAKPYAALVMAQEITRMVFGVQLEA